MLPMQGARVWTLVRELRFHMLNDMAKKKKKKKKPKKQKPKQPPFSNSQSMQSGVDAPPSPEMGTYRSAEAESQGGR